MGRSLGPAEAKHLCFCWRQLNSRCCQHHIILGVPIYMKAALRKVTSLNSWWLNGFWRGNSSPRCVVLAAVWCNLFCYWIRQREKRDHKEIFHFMRGSWSHRSCMSCLCSFLLIFLKCIPWYRMPPHMVSIIMKCLYISQVNLKDWHSLI